MIETSVREAASRAARIAPTLPSIMSDGAMMSQPACASASACFTRTATLSSLPIAPLTRTRALDGAYGAADQIFRVEGLAAVFVAQRGVGIGKQRQTRDRKLCCPFR